MQLIRQTSPAPLQPHELFFLELWHEMTHEKSLDSYRVRCLNSHIALREIGEELTIGRIPYDELKSLCAEAMEILDSDTVIASAYPHHIEIIRRLLADAVNHLKKDEDGKAKAWRSELNYAVADFLDVIRRGYLDNLLADLPNVLATADHNQIAASAGILLSELVDRGWPLETLYSWVQLAVAYGTSWTPSKLDELLSAVGYAGSNLED